MKSKKELILQQFREQFPKAAEPLVVWAPGRVNLLGEHTDYNDGFVFPMAIDVGITMAGAFNGTDQVNIYSVNFSARDSFSLQELVPSATQKWSNYIRGVCQQFALLGFELKGLDLVVEGNVPQGAGLSSSAALEVAAAVLLDALHGWEQDRVELVKLAQRAENDFVGVDCGIMDQFASMMGQENHALFLDCRSLGYDLIPLPFERQGYAVAVVNSRVQRGLVDSEYNLRREQCEGAVELLGRELSGIKSLRDVAMEHLPLVNGLPDVLAKRARHVVTENNKVLAGIKALEAGDLVQFGELLTASHLSLRDDFEVSRKELDLLVELALGVPGVLGARMTGAGFGGCIIALVPERALREFKERVFQGYKEETGLEAEIYVFKPTAGAGPIL